MLCAQRLVPLLTLAPPLWNALCSRTAPAPAPALSTCLPFSRPPSPCLLSRGTVSPGSGDLRPTSNEDCGGAVCTHVRSARSCPVIQARRRRPRVSLTRLLTHPEAFLPKGLWFQHVSGSRLGTAPPTRSTSHPVSEGEQAGGPGLPQACPQAPAHRSPAAPGAFQRRPPPGDRTQLCLPGVLPLPTLRPVTR